MSLEGIPPIGAGTPHVEPGVALPITSSGTFINPNTNPYMGGMNFNPMMMGNPMMFGGGFGMPMPSDMNAVSGYGYMPTFGNRFDLDRERHHNYVHASESEGRDNGRITGLFAGAATGAAIGAAISWWTGPGVVVGAAVGGVIGAVAGLFGGGSIGSTVAGISAERADARDDGILNGSPGRMVGQH